MHVNDTGRTNIYQSAYKQFHCLFWDGGSKDIGWYLCVSWRQKSNMPGSIGSIGSIRHVGTWDTVNQTSELLRPWRNRPCPGLRPIFRINHNGLNMTMSCRRPPYANLAFLKAVSLGPILFSLFVAPFADLIYSHGLSFHQFADDTQLYVSVIPKSPQTSLVILDKCSCALLEWFSNNGLALNPTKSEVLFCGTRVNIDTTHQIQSVQVVESSRPIPSKVSGLPWMVSSTSINTLMESAWQHTSISELSNTSAAPYQSTVSAIVGSRLDYYNGILYGVSAKNIKKLQMVQNTLARVVQEH